MSGVRTASRIASRALSRIAPLGLALAAASPAPALADRAILVGGGYSIHRSEVQIERNAAWIREVLTRAGVPVTLHYTDGDAPGSDVQWRVRADAPPSTLEPVARAFGTLREERTRWRNHTLEDVAGSTERGVLEPALVADLARADARGEPVMLVYNGHGTQSPTRSPAGVRLELWNRTGMRASELHALLAGHEAPVRWVFTQCYSGGFHRLAYADPDAGTALADGMRCGFTAESAYRLAEGCSASIETDDYRDYSTFLFAALDGADREGEALVQDPDTDADGVVTPREAHLYALAHAWSSDLSRSTSEDFLDAWQPWWLRWLPRPAHVPDNEYAHLHRALSARLGVAPDAGPDAVRDAMAGFKATLGELGARRATLRAEEERLGGIVAGAVAERWPALYGPYTDAYRELVASGEIEAVASAIRALPEYAALVAAQQADEVLDGAMIEAERASVQHAKLLRFRRLATLVEQLGQWGDERDRAAYASLVACESMPLGTAER